MRPLVCSEVEQLFHAALERAPAERYYWVTAARGLVARIPRSRRWRVSLAGRRTMSTAIKLREVAYPALFAAAA
jgi:hypothetical protein